MIEIPRRKFLAGLGFIACAPAIVRASSLMPVRAIKSDRPLMTLLALDSMPNYRVVMETSEDGIHWVTSDSRPSGDIVRYGEYITYGIAAANTSEKFVRVQFVGAS